MTTRDKPVMRLVIDTIEREGPMTVKAIMDLLGMTRGSVSKQCLRGCDDGYLTMDFDKSRPCFRRDPAIYTRTDKAYDIAVVAKKTLTKRERVRREQDNQRRKESRAEVAKERSRRSQPFTPFRHPEDELFYGAMKFSGDFSTVKPRIIDRWAEKEAA